MVFFGKRIFHFVSEKVLRLLAVELILYGVSPWGGIPYFFYRNFTGGEARLSGDNFIFA